MTLAGLLPDADLLTRVEGVEAGLRRLRKLGRGGQVGFVVVAAMQVVTRTIDAGAFELDPSVARAIDVAEAVSLVGLPLFLSLLAVSRYWLRQARQPFRYTCSIEDFRAAPESPAVAKMAWLRYDLERLLNERVARLTFRDSDEEVGDGENDSPRATHDHGEDNGEPSHDRAHFHVAGIYVVREGRIEVMPSVRIGSRASARTLAHPISHTLEARDLPPQQYRELLERVYFSVATEMYRQIEDDVAHKISLLRTSYLQARGLFYEAEDYARSNTLAAYEQAARLYDAAARRLDPALEPLPSAGLRRHGARLRRAASGLRRRVRLLIARVHSHSAEREVLWARCRIGYADMLLSRRLMSLLSGQRINAVFEARHVARDAFARLHDEIPPGVPDRDRALFDTHVTLALVLNELGDRTGAREQLAAAQARDPVRADRDPRYLRTLGETETNTRSRINPLRRAAELDQRFEASHWALAYELEMGWRRWGDLEGTKADVVLEAYRDVLRLNPSNLGAWANTGYICWLLGQRKKAADAFRSGRSTRAVSAETFVAELDHGLARIAAERGRFQHAYRHASDATAALVANGVAHAPGGYAPYYFSNISEAMTARFRAYEKAVRDRVAAAREKGQLSARILDVVEAFVLTDVGECLAWSSAAVIADGRREVAAGLWKEAEEHFDLAISLDPDSVLSHYLRRNMLRGSSDPESWERCRVHVAAIQRLEPGWPDGILLAVETEGERAAIARNRAADGARKIADKEAHVGRLTREISESRAWQQFSPELLGAVVAGTPIGLLAAVSGAAIAAIHQLQLHAPDSADSNGLQPDAAATTLVQALGGALQDKLQELRRSKAELEELRRTHRAALREAHDATTTATAAIRRLVPHNWLWAADGTFDWPVLADPDPDYQGRWERQLEELHVRALYNYGRVLLGTEEADGEAGPVRAADLLERLAEVFWPRDPEVLQALLVAHAASGRHDTVEVVFHRLDDATVRAAIDLLKPTYDDHPEWQAVVVAAACRQDRLGIATAVWLAEKAAELCAQLPHDDASRDDLERAAAQAARRGLDATDAATVFAAAQALESLDKLDDFDAYGDVLALDHTAGRPTSDTEALQRASRELTSRTAIAAKLLLEEEPELAYAQVEQLITHGRPLVEGAKAVARRLIAACGEKEPDRLRAIGRGFRRWLRDVAADPSDRTSWRDVQLAALEFAALEPPPGRRSGTRQWLLPVVTPLAVELAPDLLATADAETELQARASTIRDDINREFGVRTPVARIRRNEDLLAGTYVLMFEEVPLVSGVAEPGRVFVPGYLPITGDPMNVPPPGWNPMTGRFDGAWLATDVDGAGWPPLDYVAHHLRAFVEEHLAGFVGIQEVANTLEAWVYDGTAQRPGRAALLSRVRALDPDYSTLTGVLRGLVAERVPIVRIHAILRSFLAASGAVDRVALIERMRTVMRDKIPANHPDRPRTPLPHELEEAIRQHTDLWNGEERLAFPPEVLDQVLRSLRSLVDGSDDPVLVTAADIRPLVRRVLDIDFPSVPVLADTELRVESAEPATTDHDALREASVEDGTHPAAAIGPAEESDA